MTKNYEINTKEDFIHFCCSNYNRINEYIDEKQSKISPPLTNSVDIRESRTKIAPIDNNIYPAGFNNVCQLDLESASKQFAIFFKNNYDHIKKVTIYPESHTKNLFYLDHLSFLKKALMDGGFEVQFASLDGNLFGEQEKIELVSFSKFSVDIEKIQIKDGEFFTGNQKCEFVLLNNDQSSEIPVEWKNIKTPVLPSAHIGWNYRQKTTHFTAYEQVANEFGEIFSINPNLINARFKTVEGVDFTAKEGFEKIANELEILKQEISKDSDEEVNFFIKASQGTYGMGIMTAKTPEEVLSMNKKTRHKMNAGKNKIKFTSVIIQEGVKTILKYENLPAEIAIYLVNGQSIGGFMRVNEQKSDDSNLNSKGMVFKKFCISELKENRDDQAKEAAYSVVARLSCLAAAEEINQINLV